MFRKAMFYFGVVVLVHANVVAAQKADKKRAGFVAPTVFKTDNNNIDPDLEIGSIVYDLTNNAFFGLGVDETGANAKWLKLSNSADELSSFYGGVKWVAASNCSWERTSNTSFGTYSVDSDCTTPTGSNIYGSAAAPGTKIPGIQLNDLPAGEYYITATAVFGSTSSAEACSFRWSDGTNVTNPVSTDERLTGVLGNVGAVSGRFRYTTAGDRTIELQSTGRVGNANCVVRNDNTTTGGFEILIYRFPL